MADNRKEEKPTSIVHPEILQNEGFKLLAENRDATWLLRQSKYGFGFLTVDFKKKDPISGSLKYISIRLGCFPGTGWRNVSGDEAKEIAAKAEKDGETQDFGINFGNMARKEGSFDSLMEFLTTEQPSIKKPAFKIADLLKPKKRQASTAYDSYNDEQLERYNSPPPPRQTGMRK